MYSYCVLLYACFEAIRTVGRSVGRSMKLCAAGYAGDDGVLRHTSVGHVLRPFHRKTLHLQVSFFFPAKQMRKNVHLCVDCLSQTRTFQPACNNIVLLLIGLSWVRRSGMICVTSWRCRSTLPSGAWKQLFYKKLSVPVYMPSPITNKVMNTHYCYNTTIVTLHKGSSRS